MSAKFAIPISFSCSQTVFRNRFYTMAIYFLIISKTLVKYWPLNFRMFVSDVTGQNTQTDYSAYRSERDKFDGKKWWNYNVFGVFMYIWFVLKFFMFFFVWRACQNNAAISELSTGQPVNSDKYCQHKNILILVVAAVVACPIRHKNRHWGTGISEYTFGSTIQNRAIPPHSWRSAPLVTTDSL